MNRRLTVVVAVVAVVLTGVVVLSVVGFGSSPQSKRPDPAQMIDSGSWYQRGEGFHWPHDGHPYETEHFVVYSDGASQRARQRLAALAEDVLVDVVDEMGVDPATMFRFPAGQDKIDIYPRR
jgi:hypothetical protein